MPITPEERLQRAMEIDQINSRMTLPGYALPNGFAVLNKRYAEGVITFEEKAKTLEVLYGISLAAQLEREAAVGQANASIALEGLELAPEAILINARYISGELDLEQKLHLIKKLYGTP